MSKGLRATLGAGLLVLGVIAGLEWASEQEEAETPAIDAGEPATELRRRAPRPSRPDAPARQRGVPSAIPTRPGEASARAGPEIVEDRRPEGDLPVVAPAPEPDAGGEEQGVVGRREYDGDLGRATLKGGHLRDRSRELLGGGDLGDLNQALDPGRPLGEATLTTAHLRDRTRESLGGGDLRDLVSAEPGNLGARSLKSGDLRDLSRDPDDHGDLADRSGR
jgi:hypothetical protein